MSESYQSSGSDYGSGSTSGTGSSGSGSSGSSSSGSNYGGGSSTGSSYGGNTSTSGGVNAGGSQSGSGYSGSSSTGSSIEPVGGGRGEGGRTVLIGVLGGLLSAAGYAIYQRLPDEQKTRLQRQVRGMLEQRLNEIRQNFNI